MTNARKGIVLPTGHGETRGDATKLVETFLADGTVKPHDVVKLNADEKTLNLATSGSDAWIGVLPYFDGTEVDWGTTTPSRDTAYPSGTKIPWIYTHGYVVARIDASEIADNTQMGAFLQPAAAGFGNADGSGYRRAIAADRLVGNVSDGLGEVII